MSKDLFLLTLIAVNILFFIGTAIWYLELKTWKVNFLKQIKYAEKELNEKVTNHNANVTNLSNDLQRKGIAKEKELYEYALHQNTQTRGIVVYVSNVLRSIPASSSTVDPSDQCATLVILQEYTEKLDTYIKQGEERLSEINE